MPGYMKPCRYCDELVASEAKVCPACGKDNPVGPLRCPKCRSPIEPGWLRCSNCGLTLKVECPSCSKDTFFSDYCEHCGARLLVQCPNPKCGFEQPPLGKTCAKCSKPMQ